MTRLSIPLAIAAVVLVASPAAAEEADPVARAPYAPLLPTAAHLLPLPAHTPAAADAWRPLPRVSAPDAAPEARADDEPNPLEQTISVLRSFRPWPSRGGATVKIHGSF